VFDYEGIEEAEFMHVNLLSDEELIFRSGLTTRSERGGSIAGKTQGGGKIIKERTSGKGLKGGLVGRTVVC